MSGIQQMLTGGTYKPAPPVTIGQAYGGGFYAGKISTAGTGVADYYLIVAPYSTGNALKKWGPEGVATGQTSVINGPTNSVALAALGSTYEAATFCEGLTIGGYTDWYLPAKNELEVCYYFLHPDTATNDTSAGSNANAVSPEPISANYSSSSPAQTTASLFVLGQSEAFYQANYWSSTEGSANGTWVQAFSGGGQGISAFKGYNWNTRAVRRVPV
jgi:hypothetical protein